MSDVVPVTAEKAEVLTPQSTRLNPFDRAKIFGIELRGWRLVWLVVGLAVALILPFVVPGFTIFQLTQAIIYAMAIQGLNLLTGYNGQFSLGHSAFYAIGAYTAAIMMFHYEIHYLWTLPVAFVISLFVGFLFGFPALRLEGLHLALATFALAVATPQLLKWKPIEGWTGGVQGLFVFQPDPPLGLPLTQDQYLYYLCLAVMIILFVCAWNIVRGRTGRALIAIRDNPLSAKSMGINTSLYKSLTFGVSAAYTGVAGALGAIVVGFVAPDSFTFLLAVLFLVGLVVGGVASIWGPIIGGIFVLFIPNISDNVQTMIGGWFGWIGINITWLVYGVFLILVVYFMPSGFAGLWRWLTNQLLRLSKPSA